MRTLVLCYHSQILGGNEYGNNGHVAPASDLEVIHASGALIVPARRVADWVHGTVAPDDDRPRVALTFDDRSILDFASTQHPEFGTQPGLQRILRDFHRRNGNVQPTLHATSFVIGSEQARVEMDERCPYRCDWMGATWWKNAEGSGLIEIGNHSCNHKNPACSDVPPNAGGSNQ